jgi:non-ribosomal peptide synthetase component F
MVLLAGARALLARLTGQGDIVIGTPIANREQRELEDLVGFFVNTLAIRTELSPDDPFTTVLAREREAALAAFDHQATPFELVVDALHLERRADLTPLFQVWFVHQNMHFQAPVEDASSVESTGLESASKFDLALYTMEVGGAIRFTCVYNADLFDDSTIEQIVADYRALLAEVATHPTLTLAELLSS